MLLKPGHEESFTFSKYEDSWHRWIAVHFDSIPEFTVVALNELPVCLPLSEEMNQLTDLIVKLFRQGSSEDEHVRSLGLAALHLYPQESAKAMLQREKHPAIYAALTWIGVHYPEEVSLSDIAVNVGISREHLVRLFKQYEQKTPFQYLWQYRVERAIELLMNTGLTVSEIAQLCGFKTSNHLARLVKYTTGRTATGIRRLSWAGLRKA